MWVTTIIFNIWHEKGARVNLQKKENKQLIYTAKGGFLQIAFTIVIAEFHILEGEERNKTD